MLATAATLLAVLLAVGIAAFCLFRLYFQHVTHWLGVTHHDIHVPHWEGRALTIVHLTDFHFDPADGSLRPAMLEEIVRQTALARPDLVLLTGDYVNARPEPIDELCRACLSRLRAAHGVFASLGNHDHYRPHARARITDALRAAGVTVLRNDAATLPAVGGGRVSLVGLEDLWSSAWAAHPAVLERVRRPPPAASLVRGDGVPQVCQRRPPRGASLCAVSARTRCRERACMLAPHPPHPPQATPPLARASLKFRTALPPPTLQAGTPSPTLYHPYCPSPPPPNHPPNHPPVPPS